MAYADLTRQPLHSRSGPDTYWSTTNVGEAFPGVVTPLGWSLCGPGVEVGIRDSYARVGALPRKEVRVPDRVEDRLISVFYGRGALNVNFFCRMGARLPGRHRTPSPGSSSASCPPVSPPAAPCAGCRPSR
ncbi:hypothetical protein ACWV95_00935 [Streptomyces albus]